jgi:tetratricopeptide (TPR) repeat protein
LEIFADNERRTAASADGAETALFPAPDPTGQEVELETSGDLDQDREKAEPSQATPRRVTWKALAKQGKYSDAVIQAERFGVTRIIGSASAPDLMALGDAARHAGKQRLAVMVYESVRERFPNTSHASSAAFSLGKMAFDKRRAYREAARWFRACLNESKNNVLEKEASGRLMEALRLAGDERGAREEAIRYLRRFPQGPHAPLAKKLAADLR